MKIAGKFFKEFQENLGELYIYIVDYFLEKQYRIENLTLYNRNTNNMSIRAPEHADSTTTHNGITSGGVLPNSSDVMLVSISAVYRVFSLGAFTWGNFTMFTSA